MPARGCGFRKVVVEGFGVAPRAPAVMLMMTNARTIVRTIVRTIFSVASALAALFFAVGCNAQQGQAAPGSLNVQMTTLQAATTNRSQRVALVIGVRVLGFDNAHKIGRAHV